MISFKGHIAIEGPIGVGKTTFAELLTDRFDARLVLEEVENNPFLADFYKDRRKYAFQTQIFFLMSRYAQQEQLAHADLFAHCTVSDYVFAKDKLFARLNLSEKEMGLYDKVISVLERNIKAPDLVIYLTASVNTLIQRIKKRGRHFEKGFDKDYLESLREIYGDFFFSYNDSPLLVIKTDNVDFSVDEDKLSYVIDKIVSGIDSTEYISFDSVLKDS